jgi:hypothetical protein
MKIFIHLFILVVIGTLGGLALKSAFGTAAKDAVYGAYWNRFVAPEVPATYYVDDINRCYEVTFVMPADVEYPAIEARHRIDEVASSACDLARKEHKLVVYPDRGPDAQITDLQ